MSILNQKVAIALQHTRILSVCW